MQDPYFQWRTYLQTFLNQRTDVGDIYFHGRDLRVLKALGAMLDNWPPQIITQYLQFQVLVQIGTQGWSSHSITYAAERAEAALTKSYMQPADARWKTCFKFTDAAFQFMIGRMFVETEFSINSKQVMKNIVAHLKLAFEKMITESDWISDAMRQRILKKLRAIHEKIAYPDWIFDPIRLQGYYEDVRIGASGSDFFQNMIEVEEFRSRQRGARLGKYNYPEDPEKWSDLPAD